MNHTPTTLYAYERPESIRVWRNNVYEALNDARLEKVAERWLSCSDNPKTKKRPVEGASVPRNAEKIYVCSADHTHEAEIFSQTCDLRICPECARRHSARLVHRYLPKMLELSHQHGSNFRFRHVIFTTPYGLESPDIRKRLLCGFKQVERAMSRVMKTPRWKGVPYLKPSWKDSQGYLAGAEFGEIGHKLHFHVVHYGQYLDQANLVLAWKKATGGECQIVFVKGFPYVGMTIEQTLREVLKYCVKFYSEDKTTGTIKALPAHLMPVLAHTLEGTRRIRAYGVFYNLPEPVRADHTCSACGQKMVAIPLDYFVTYCNTGLLPHEFYLGTESALLFKPADKSPIRSTASPPESLADQRKRQMEMDILKKLRWQSKDEF